ncbi:hypothetical protein AK812_SmicGene28920 [Symbiodinium microadriaticum]|uniref:Uncharacterized protein n=1 Tax=Symbiodinium microadriaticum TaxID=2951 RepID=A0A1Q9D360_SYMMI|nr:hypothetical protein AK812_SmicGene28920 [Symbiodinium microadriaticum]
MNPRYSPGQNLLQTLEITPGGLKAFEGPYLKPSSVVLGVLRLNCKVAELGGGVVKKRYIGSALPNELSFLFIIEASEFQGAQARLSAPPKFPGVARSFEKESYSKFCDKGYGWCKPVWMLVNLDLVLMRKGLCEFGKPADYMDRLVNLDLVLMRKGLCEFGKPADYTDRISPKPLPSQTPEAWLKEDGGPPLDAAEACGIRQYSLGM